MSAALAGIIGSIAAEFLTNQLLSGVSGATDKEKTDKISRVIEKVFSDGKLDGVDLSDISKLPGVDVLFAKVKTAIEKIPGIGPIGGSFSDDLIKKILGVCLGNPASNRRNAGFDDKAFSVFPVGTPDEVKKIVGKRGHWIVYRIKNPGALNNLKPPSVAAEAENLIDIAFGVWQSVIDLHVLKVKPEIEGVVNLEIIVTELDGTGNKLAEATVGFGPAGTRTPYDMRIDINEEWTREKFLYAITHEIGHLLGFEHVESLGDIMDAFAPPDPGTVLKIQEMDAAFLNPDPKNHKSIQTAQDAWGVSPV